VLKQKLHGFLGHKVFESEVAERVVDPGVATGLAWTPTGGDILFIEATQMVGRGQLILTGSLGEVMKESAHAALSFIRANARKLKIEQNFARKLDFHIHVPAGAIPKDGPSAGLAMVVALMSLVMQRPVAGDVAMSGEITLRGKVMPVGGIKEKVLAAARAGIKRVVLPKRNERNLEDLPSEVRRKLQFIFVRTVSEAIHYVLSKRSAKNRKPGKKVKG
jgi:ATP-dependent Lon protease